MLHLLSPTDPRWVQVAEQHLCELLSDHAHCELKAAHAALSLVGRYGGRHPELVAPMVALAQEESEHFGQVMVELRRRGGELSTGTSDAYVAALRRVAGRTRADHAPALLDRLLVSALVEARSCERFALLAEHMADAELRTFYRDLMASEARHHRLFTGLAESIFERDAVRSRLAELARLEAELAESLPLGPTMHG